MRKAELRTKLTECQHRVEQLLTRNQALRGLVAGLHSEVGVLTTDLAESEAARETLAERVDLLEAALEDLAEQHPEPPTPVPVPPANWTTKRVLSKRSDWASYLNEGFQGASIVDIADGFIRANLPGPQTADGGRIEVQDYLGTEGQRCAYEFKLHVPAWTVLSTAYPRDPKNILTQHHADRGAGYTGGLSLYPDGRLSLRIKGGHEISLAGSHPYEYEDEIVLDPGTIRRGVIHNVRVEVHWHRTDGSARLRVDDGAWKGLTHIPTWPIGDADGVPSTKIMYRHGLYPQGGIVQGNMTVDYGPLTFQVAA